MAERERVLISPPLLIKTSVRKIPPSGLFKPNYRPKAQLQTSSQWGFRASTSEFGGGGGYTHIQPHRCVASGSSFSFVVGRSVGGGLESVRCSLQTGQGDTPAAGQGMSAPCYYHTKPMARAQEGLGIANPAPITKGAFPNSSALHQLPVSPDPS